MSLVVRPRRLPFFQIEAGTISVARSSDSFPKRDLFSTGLESCLPVVEFETSIITEIAGWALDEQVIQAFRQAPVGQSCSGSACWLESV
jgi:hypothetical protein